MGVPLVMIHFNGILGVSRGYPHFGNLHMTIRGVTAVADGRGFHGSHRSQERVLAGPVGDFMGFNWQPATTGDCIDKKYGNLRSKS